jgi:hypothetical protein
VAEPLALRQLQERLYRLIVAPEGVAPGLVALGLTATDLERSIVGDERLSATARLDLYADMYFFRLRDLVRDELPKLAAVLGDGAFHDLMVDYLRACPPEHPSVAQVGARLPSFLLEAEPERPWLATLAALERARTEVFDAADAETVSLEALRARPKETFAALRLELVPALRLLPVRAAVHEVWRQIEAGQPWQAPPLVDGTLLVWRRGYREVFHRPVADLELAALILAQGGARFGAVCDLYAEQLPVEQAGLAAFQLLGRWATDGVLRSPS